MPHPTGLTRLEIHNLRNITHAELTALGAVNIILGPNGSGKTSLLEAICLLGKGQSFRTTSVNTLIQHHAKSLLVVGHLSSAQGIEIPVGLERTSAKTSIKLDGQKILRLSDLARTLPIQVISPESSSVIDAGPKFRRQIMDWGVFHVKHGYIEIWKNYIRCLKQRNALLHQGAGPDALAPWDRLLLSAGETLHRERVAYFSELAIRFKEVAEKLIDFGQVEIKYQPGWSEKFTYADALAQATQDDCARGRTSVGPHRSDLRITIAGRPVGQVASRGQKKLIVYALKLAQLETIMAITEKSGVLLVDDIAAELDGENRAKLFAYICSRTFQVFLTATDVRLLPQPLPPCTVFHVEHGIFTATP